MRKFKILMAVMISMLAFGLTSYAATFNFDENVTVEGNTATVKLTLDSSSEYRSIAQFSTLYFEIGDGLEFSYEDGATITDENNGKGVWTDASWVDEGVINWTYETDVEFANPSDYSFVMTFTVKDTGDKTVKLRADGQDYTYLTTADGDDFVGVEEVSITIPSSEPPVDPEPPVQEEPEAGDVIEVDNKTAVIDDAGKTRFVVSATETNIPSTTAASVLKVTYDNVTKQANLYKLLGVEDLENAGTLTIGSLTVKVILGEDVTEASQVGAVSFVIQ